MERTLFSDLIAALGKVSGRLKAIITLLRSERESMCKALGETSRLVDTTLNRVSIRLGGILRYQADDDFLATPCCVSEALSLEIGDQHRFTQVHVHTTTPQEGDTLWTTRLS